MSPAIIRGKAGCNGYLHATHSPTVAWGFPGLLYLAAGHSAVLFQPLLLSCVGEAGAVMSFKRDMSRWRCGWRSWLHILKRGRAAAGLSMTLHEC